jgi:hypothetical protein
MRDLGLGVLRLVLRDLRLCLGLRGLLARRLGVSVRFRLLR